MYLSRVKLDPNRRETMRALASPQLLHGAVEQSFNGSRQRTLWRVDRLGDAYYLLVLSAVQPDLTHVAMQFGSQTDRSLCETRNYDQLLARLTAGQSWQFRLRANPVHSLPRGKPGASARGKIVAHVTPEHQKEWLLKRAAALGFSLQSDRFDVVHIQWMKFRKRKDSNREVSLSVAVFEGVLSITDAELFRRTLTQGIGRAKAYGCGLLTIARLGGGSIG